MAPPDHPGISRESLGDVLEFEEDIRDQTAVSRLLSRPLKCMPFETGHKVFQNCPKCHLFEHIGDFQICMLPTNKLKNTTDVCFPTESNHTLPANLRPSKCARRHFSQLSEFERGLIIRMKTTGWSTRRVAGQVDRLECAVRNCWEQWTRAENRVWSDQEDHEDRGSKDHVASTCGPPQ
ncbi:uncharacterized protein TNCV_3962381 [Trichonephila clavipes]|nr:uncharacterized protein TNCV_3962381 [Trichonephila clavipes]